MSFRAYAIRLVYSKNARSRSTPCEFIFVFGVSWSLESVSSLVLCGLKGRRRLGDYIKKCKDNIKINLKVTGREIVDQTELDEDRVP